MLFPPIAFVLAVHQQPAHGWTSTSSNHNRAHGPYIWLLGIANACRESPMSTAGPVVGRYSSCPPFYVCDGCCGSGYDRIAPHRLGLSHLAHLVRWHSDQLDPSRCHSKRSHEHAAAVAPCLLCHSVQLVTYQHLRRHQNQRRRQTAARLQELRRT